LEVIALGFLLFVFRKLYALRIDELNSLHERRKAVGIDPKTGGLKRGRIASTPLQYLLHFGNGLPKVHFDIVKSLVFVCPLSDWTSTFRGDLNALKYSSESQLHFRTTTGMSRALFA
jgi:hypothetical protein